MAKLNIKKLEKVCINEGKKLVGLAPGGKFAWPRSCITNWPWWSRYLPYVDCQLYDINASLKIYFSFDLNESKTETEIRCCLRTLYFGSVKNKYSHLLLTWERE